MKKAARKLVVRILYWQVKRLQKKNKIKVIAVTGSVGKTSTKWAIAKVLSQKYKIRFQEGNYNDLVSVPLIFFGQNLPSLLNPLAWCKVFLLNQIQLFKNYPYEIVVVELGTDGPGQIEQFKQYLQAEIGVVTAVTPEHMEYFEDLAAVAKEELAISEFSNLTLVNKDLLPASENISNCLTYAVNSSADFKMKDISFDEGGCSFAVDAGGETIFRGRHEAISEPQLYSILAAVSVAYKLDLNQQEIEKGISTIEPVAGRMRQLKGLNNSIILDDTYNASPEAVAAALKTLYRLKAPQKIAILGNMNELGKYSEEEHRKIGELCDPKKIDLLVTIGPDANKYLAAAAEAKGCRVMTFDDPYSAGEFIKTQLKEGALVLAKGSQNKVFAEEAVKILLDNSSDVSQLVRQSAQWLRIKERNFK